MRGALLVVSVVVAGAFLVEAARGEVRIVVDHVANATADPGFKFQRVPSPSANDAATGAKVSIIDGTRDGNSGDPEKLADGRVPDEPDQPSQNIFFDHGTDGGRILFDLGSAIDVKQVNTYSWHPSDRAPQVYKLYAGAGRAANFAPEPRIGTNPERVGWTLLASVDTRSPNNARRDHPAATGGQYAVSISDTNGSLGEYRYLLFEVFSTEDEDEYGNTFFSEIDVVPSRPTTAATAAQSATENRRPASQPIRIEGKYVAIDVTQAPDLERWARAKLLPVCDEWYPRIVKLLPSDGYTAPERCTIEFRNNLPPGIPAATSAGRVACNSAWFRRNLEGEARGAVVHELVHVVQQYGRARRTGPDRAPNPGWMVEGIADYVRWFLYEPQSRGAVIRDPARAKYDASYRTTANFLNWVTEKYDRDLVTKMNAAMRQGKYANELWNRWTGKSAEELGQEWKDALSAPARTAATQRQ